MWLLAFGWHPFGRRISFGVIGPRPDTRGFLSSRVYKPAPAPQAAKAAFRGRKPSAFRLAEALRSGFPGLCSTGQKGRDVRGLDNQPGETTMTTNDTKPKSNKPAYIAYQVRDGSSDKGFFSRIGAAWKNADGKGFNIQLDAVPLDGRITLRVLEDRPE